jgi:phage gpG-like protein
MAYRLQIIHQDFGATALMRQLKAKLDDPTPVMADFGGRMKGSIDKNFEAEGRPVRWAKLNFSTLVGWISGRKTAWTKKGRMSKEGKEAWRGRKILHRRGRLQNSISYRAFANRVEIFTNVKYAIFHQLGTRKMPARPFLLVQAEDWNYFINRWTDYLKVA